MYARRDKLPNAKVSDIEWPCADEDDESVVEIVCRSAVGGVKRKVGMRGKSASGPSMELNNKLTPSKSPSSPKKRAQTRIARQTEEKQVDSLAGPPILSRCDDIMDSVATTSTSCDDELMEDLPPPLSPIGKPTSSMVPKSNSWSEIKSGTFVPIVPKDEPSSSRLEPPSWKDKLVENYGCPEIAKSKPWLSEEEKAILKAMPADQKFRKKFTVHNFDEDLEDVPERPLFELPSPSELTENQQEALNYINASIALYRTMLINAFNPKSNDNEEDTPMRPLFLPFLRRNLRYNKFVPRKMPRAVKKPVNKKIAPKPEKMEVDKLKSPPLHDDSSDDILSCSQDIIVKLVSIRHNLLPTGYHASITFYYTMRDSRTNKFTEVRKIASSSVKIEVKDEIVPVLIDMPVDCEFTEDDGKDIYIILRVVFFEEPQEVSAGRSLRNVPARIAGQCERAREEQTRSKSRGREKRITETVMYGTYQITECISDEWVCHGGTTPVILVDEQKLNQSLKGRSWQSDGSTVLNIVSLAKKFHMNPFVHLNVKSADDDETTLKSVSPKRRKIEAESEDEPMSSDDTFGSNNHQVCDDFDYEMPSHMIYQLELDMFRKPVENGHRRKPIIQPPRSLAEEMIQKDPTLHAALAECDAKAPPPQRFAYCTVTSPQHCVFCEAYHSNLFALMWHLKTCHSRFSYVYRSAIEYKPGHYCPGFVMKVAKPQEDVHSQNQKTTLDMFDHAWPRQYLLSDSFITPCNALFQEITDGLTEVMSRHEYNDYFNKYGPRPLQSNYTVSGRLDVKIPDWTMQKMIRDLNDITDLDTLEIKFFELWNKFVCENGRPCGKETDCYKICRMFVEKHRELIQEELVLMPMMSMFVYFRQENMINEDEFYDISMRINRDYDPETDIVHPVQEHYRKRAQKGIARAERQAYREAHRRPKKEHKFGPSTRVLRSKTDSSSRENINTQSSMDSLASSNADLKTLTSSESCPGLRELAFSHKRPRFIVGASASSSAEATPSNSRGPHLQKSALPRVAETVQRTRSDLRVNQSESGDDNLNPDAAEASPNRCVLM